MFLQKKNKPKAKTDKQYYEEIGRMVANIYETGYIDHNQTYKMSFLKGLLGGLGGVIGATIIVGLLLWTLSLFQDVPFVGRFTDNIRSTLQRKSPPK